MHRILIANRGAIARRIVRACRDLNVQSIVVYAEADAGAPYIEEADDAFALPGSAPRETYLNRERLLDVARHYGADGLHPGYGFLAENAEFAQAVHDAGLTFVGPSPRWLSRMGDKVAARTLMAEHGFPVFPGSAAIEDMDAARAAAEQIGFPVLVKPAGGGGGMGMERVDRPDGLEAAVNRARAIANSAFSSSGVYLEKWLDRPRHIEYQLIADKRGNALHAFERECSVQRRNQKLIEESPAPGLDSAAVLAQAEQAAAVCQTLGYDNLGTLETLWAPDGSSGFLEMNTRIQVEHAVTEAVTGLDLVRTQIELAYGADLPDAPRRSGFAIEARIYAEDPLTLLPSTGRLAVFRPPVLHAVRVETGYREGQTLTPYYDAMLAKVIAWADTRELAIGRLLVALKAFEVRGVKTNQALLMRVLEDQEFLAGRVDTGIIGRILKGGK